MLLLIIRILHDELCLKQIFTVCLHCILVLARYTCKYDYMKCLTLLCNSVLDKQAAAFVLL